MNPTGKEMPDGGGATAGGGEARDPAAVLSSLRLGIALERELAQLRPAGLPAGLRGPHPVVPVLGAVLASRSLDTPGGDVLSMRRSSPAALVAAGLDPELIARQARGTARSWARGWDPGGVPGLHGWGLIPAVDPPGTLVEVLAGVAMAFGLRDEPRVALLVTDAADADSGYWHEGVNFAAVRRAPLVVVSHPGGGRGPAPRRPTLTARAAFYGATGTSTPGTDVLEVVEAVRGAVERARSGGGCQFVEVLAASPEVDANAEARLAEQVGGSGLTSDEARLRARTAADGAWSDAAADLSSAPTAPAPSGSTFLSPDHLQEP